MVIDVKNEAAREAFVDLARSAAHEARDGQNKGALSVQFEGGDRGVQAALQIVEQLQKSKLVRGRKLPPAFEALAGSRQTIHNAEINVHSGGKVSLSFTPRELEAEEVTSRLHTAALRAQRAHARKLKQDAQALSR